MSRTRRSRGFAALELAILAPLVIPLIMFVVYEARMYLAQQIVDEAAHAAARAASEDASPSSAVADAPAVALATLSAHGASCTNPQITVDASAFHPGGKVVVTVACDVSLKNL